MIACFKFSSVDHQPFSASNEHRDQAWHEAVHSPPHPSMRVAHELILLP